MFLVVAAAAAIGIWSLLGVLGALGPTPVVIASGALATAALLAALEVWRRARRLPHTVRRLEIARRDAERRFHALAENATVGIWHIDSAGRTLHVNPAMRRLLRLDDDEDITGQPFDRYFAEESVGRFLADLDDRQLGHSATYEVELRPPDGGSRHLLVSSTPLLDDRGAIDSIIGTFTDITDRKAAEALLEHQALHDPLTDLPNRTLLEDRLFQALTRSRRRKTHTAVLLLDLDRFKVINDTLGHFTGDNVLVAVARRLQQAVRDEDTVAHLSGDSFAVLLEHLEWPEGARLAASRIIDNLQEPFDVAGQPVRLTASIGIAATPPGTAPEKGEDLLRFADAALHVAKGEGGALIKVYDPERDAPESDRLHLETDLWHAADRGELTLVYQPIVRLDDRRLASIEALVRWRHPVRGLIPPAEFIAMAEEIGAIESIGRWVLRRVTEQLVEWTASGDFEAPPEVSINVSNRQLRLGELAQEVDDLLAASGLPPQSLCFEITESLLLRAPSAVRRLKALGVSIAIDDFATGYSSLSILKRIDVDRLKIDRTFVSGLGASREDTALVTAIVRLARALKLEVTAEGIETTAQLEGLSEIGCDHGQGFLFSPPLTAEELEEQLRTRLTW